MYLLLAFVLPGARTWRVAGAAVVVCALIELFQLTPYPAQWGAQWPPLRLVLGTTFNAWDLPAYLGGAVGAGLLDHHLCKHGAVPASDRGSLPFAFRANAYMRTSWWRRRTVRAFRYDALWENGRVDRNINLVDLMYRHAPADYQVTQRAMLDHCPEIGTGRWIVYAAGSPIDGPA